jgi:hypothetical protein
MPASVGVPFSMLRVTMHWQGYRQPRVTTTAASRWQLYWGYACLPCIMRACGAPCAAAIRHSYQLGCSHNLGLSFSWAVPHCHAYMLVTMLGAVCFSSEPDHVTVDNCGW